MKYPNLDYVFVLKLIFICALLFLNIKLSYDKNLLILENKYLHQEFTRLAEHKFEFIDLSIPDKSVDEIDTTTHDDLELLELLQKDANIII